MSTFTTFRLDIDGKPYYFGIQAEPYTALRLVMQLLEMHRVSFPTAIKALRRDASAFDPNSLSMCLKDERAGDKVSDPLQYHTFSGKAVWDLLGRGAEFEPELVLQRKQYEEYFQKGKGGAT
ncbi:hypothetical protein KKE60_08720 [Patescibacteria group bacterium]|nr:hypothetical protein [Patescibacteria group bacterium]